MKQSLKTTRGFSLIELVIVVVIIAIIAAIAVPKMSRGAVGASEAAAMQSLAQMRSAIDLFAAEHGGTYPSTTPADFKAQLTQYSNAAGQTSALKTSTHIYGPYLKSIPPVPVGANKGADTVTQTGPGTGTAGWYYDATTIWINSTDLDSKGVAFSSY